MKIMKKLILVVMAAALIMLCACGEEKNTENKDVDLEALAGKLLESGAFAEELNRVDDGIADKLYGITNAKTAYLYVGSGAVADELALFEFESKEDAEAAVEQAQARVTAQSESFADYIPEEVKKLDSAIVKTYGRYLVVCVSGGTEAGEIISEYFK